MTTAAFIFFVVFCVAIGLFALLTFHLEDDSSEKKPTKHKSIIHKHQ